MSTADHQLCLKAMTTVTDGVEFTAVLDDDGREAVPGIVIAGVLVNLGRRQFAKLLGVDANQIGVNVTELTIWASVGINDHEAPPNRLASCDHLLRSREWMMLR